MWSEASTQTQPNSVVVHDLPDADAAQPPAKPCQEQYLIVRSGTPGPYKLRPRQRQVLFHRLDGLAANWDQAFLVSLSDASHVTQAHIHVGNTQIQHFRDPQSDRKSTRLNSSHLGISYAV